MYSLVGQHKLYRTRYFIVTFIHIFMVGYFSLLDKYRHAFQNLSLKRWERSYFNLKRTSLALNTIGKLWFCTYRMYYSIQSCSVEEKSTRTYIPMQIISKKDSLFINGDDLHVKGVNRRENIRGSLHHRFPGLRHSDWWTVSQEHRLISWAQW